MLPPSVENKRVDTGGGAEAEVPIDEIIPFQ